MKRILTFIILTCLVLTLASCTKAPEAMCYDTGVVSVVIDGKTHNWYCTDVKIYDGCIDFTGYYLNRYPPIYTYCKSDPEHLVYGPQYEWYYNENPGWTIREEQH